MKKVIALISALVLCLGLCACGGNSLENACEKADKLVSQWHRESHYDCIFKGEYLTENDGFEISLYVVDVRYPSSVDALKTSESAYVKNKITSFLRNELYPQLVDVFDGQGVSILFTLSDRNGENPWRTILN